MSDYWTLKEKKSLAHSVLCVPCSLLTHRHTHRLSLSLSHTPVSHWTLSTCDVCIMHWWRVGLLTTTCSTDYMWRNHQRSDLSCLGGRWQRGWESGGGRAGAWETVPRCSPVVWPQGGLSLVKTFQGNEVKMHVAICTYCRVTVGYLNK